MGIFSVVTLNTIWLNLKKHRDENKQNGSSHLYTGTCKLGESNWTSWLFLGPNWNPEPRLTISQFDTGSPSDKIFAAWSCLLSLGQWRRTSPAAQDPNEFGQLALIASQLARISQGTASFFLGSLANFFPMQMATTFWKYICDKKKCLVEEAGAWKMDSHLSFPPPL